MIALVLWLSLAFAQETPEVEAVPVEAVAVQETSVTAAVVLQVGQPVETTDKVIDKATELGGWFQSRTDAQVSLRIPVDRTEEMLDYLDTLGKVADRSAERHDVTRNLTDLRGRLGGREEVLVRYYEVLESADARSVVRVEQQIIQAIVQIEQIKGQIRVLEDQAAYARLTVDFRFRDRAAPRRDGSSSFAWLNSLNITDVVGGLQYAHPNWKTQAVTPVAPDGFSAWKKAKAFRAASPNGVLYRVRTVKHKPEADVEFWREAVRERMLAAGYKVVSEEETPGGGQIELASPLGQEDWTYLIRFYVSGSRLVIAEAAGEVSRLEPRRAAIDTAMAALAP